MTKRVHDIEDRTKTFVQAHPLGDSQPPLQICQRLLQALQKTDRGREASGLVRDRRNKNDQALKVIGLESFDCMADHLTRKVDLLAVLCPELPGSHIYGSVNS